jgi:anaerobic ribonucleoside-triphosphate reductase activating protein
VLRIHVLLPSSFANGPGERAVIWVQGCSLACAHCFNPETHATNAGTLLSVDDIVKFLLDLPTSVEGLTVTGGEPLQQPRPLSRMLRRVREETKLSIILMTGFTWHEMQRLPERSAILSCLDVLIAGRYDHSRRVAAGLRGSSNKSVHFLTSRYSDVDLAAVPTAEIVVGNDGELTFTGIDPVVWSEGGGT